MLASDPNEVEELRKYSLKTVKEYHYVNQTNSHVVQGLDDKEDFKEVIQCMKNIHFGKTEI